MYLDSTPFFFTFSLLSTIRQQNNFYSRSLKLETISTACEKEGNIFLASVCEWWGNNSKASHLSPACSNCFSGILADIGEWNNLKNPSLKSSNTNQILLPVKCLDLINRGSSKRSLGIELKYPLNLYTKSFKTKSNKRFQVEFHLDICSFHPAMEFKKFSRIMGMFPPLLFSCLLFNSVNKLPSSWKTYDFHYDCGALDSDEVIEKEISSLYVMTTEHYKILLYTFLKGGKK